MLITPTYIAIGRMFEQNFLFEVPKYQRYYAWEPEQVNDFIRDLDGILANSEKDHFSAELFVSQDRLMDLLANKRN